MRAYNSRCNVNGVDDTSFLANCEVTKTLEYMFGILVTGDVIVSSPQIHRGASRS